MLSKGVLLVLHSSIYHVLHDVLYHNARVCYRDDWGRRCTQVTAIDAINVKRDVDSQFDAYSMRRELNKASPVDHLPNTHLLHFHFSPTLDTVFNLIPSSMTCCINTYVKLHLCQLHAAIASRS